MTAQDPLAALLDQAGVHRDSIIRVTGSSGLSALLWLCRHGYEKVGYLKPGRSCPHEPADCLMIARTCDPITLSQLLARGPHVREGGVLVFRSPLPCPMDADDPIHSLLAAEAYDLERCVHGAHRELHIARRRSLRRPFAKAA